MAKKKCTDFKNFHLQFCNSNADEEFLQRHTH